MVDRHISQWCTPGAFGLDCLDASDMGGADDHRNFRYTVIGQLQEGVCSRGAGKHIARVRADDSQDVTRSFWIHLRKPSRP